MRIHAVPEARAAAVPSASVCHGTAAPLDTAKQAKQLLAQVRNAQAPLPSTSLPTRVEFAAPCFRTPGCAARLPARSDNVRRALVTAGQADCRGDTEGQRPGPRHQLCCQAWGGILRSHVPQGTVTGAHTCGCHMWLCGGAMAWQTCMHQHQQYTPYVLVRTHARTHTHTHTHLLRPYSIGGLPVLPALECTI